MNWHLVWIATTLAAGAVNLPAGDFELTATGRDAQISYRGQPFITAVATQVTEKGNFTPNTRTAQSALPGGGRAFNVWNPDPVNRFRQEIALHGNNANKVEITFIAENSAFQGYARKGMSIELPYAFFEGAKYRALATNGRVVDQLEGTFSPDLPDGVLGKKKIRFLAIEKGDLKLIFDFNPLGPGDYMNNYQMNAMRGIWDVVRSQDKLRFIQQTSLAPEGAMTGSKLCILPGTFEDYGKLHARQKFHYNDRMPAQHLYSFGAQRTGSQYTHADMAKFSAQTRFGWLTSDQLTAAAHSPEGAYYANVSGRNATFRIGGLPAGVHIVTVGIGNHGKLANRFEVACNREPVTAGALSVEPGKAAILSLPVWVADGSLDLEFKGDFLVSAIGVQFLLAAPEDFSFRRGMWASDGFEPSIFFRNAYIKPINHFKPVMEYFALPIPGTEMTGPRRNAARPVSVPAPDDPAMNWRYGVNFTKMPGYSHAEWDRPEVLEKYVKDLAALGYNTVMTEGLHARPTYPEHLDRARKMLSEYVRIAHANGMKVIEHHDTTLLWNTNAGFRALAERLDETARDIDNNLINYHLCIMNDRFNQKALAYYRDMVQLGVDGLQLDEAYFYTNGCVCQACREKFHQDTGWQLPMNELHPGLHDCNHPLWKAWFDWKRTQETNWLVNLRNALRDINKHLTITQYTTHYGFTISMPHSNIMRDLEEYARAVDFFGTEVMTRNAYWSARALIPYRKAFNLFQFTYGAPVWAIFYNNNWDVRYFAYALSNMNAQQAVLKHAACPRGKTDYQQFIGNPDNMDRMIARPLAKLALLYSRSSRDWNSGAGFEPELFGLAQTLEEMHVPYQVIGEDSLKPEILKSFDILSIGSSGCLADAQLQAIKAYARNGGTVWMSNIAGFYDSEGVRRPQWGFADVFGFTPGATPIKQLKSITAADGSQFDMMLPVNYYPLPQGYRAAAGVPTVAAGKNQLPVRVEKRYGQGRMIYQPLQLAGSLYAREGTVGAVWKFRRDDALAAWLHQELRQQLGNAALWTTDAPEKVYTTLYREPGRLLIHFLNATGSHMSAGETMCAETPQDAYPKLAAPIRFELASDSLEVRKVYAVSSDFEGRKALGFKRLPDGRIQAELPAELLKVYTIVILDAQP